MNLSKFSLADWANVATIIASAIAVIGFISGVAALIYRFMHRRRKKDEDGDKGNSGGDTLIIAIVFVVASVSAIVTIGIRAALAVQDAPIGIIVKTIQEAPPGTVAEVAGIILALVILLISSFGSQYHRRIVLPRLSDALYDLSFNVWRFLRSLFDRGRRSK